MIELKQTLKIQEQFVSVQGEGSLVGVPSSFIRVSGCNLRCTWCDSPHTSWSPQGAFCTIKDLVRFCAQGPKHVVITGGEPLLFSNVALLTQELHRQGHHITVETAGTVWLDRVECDLISISPKLANSTPWQRNAKLASHHEQQRINRSVLERLLHQFSWQLKFVVNSQSTDSLSTDLNEIESLLTVLGISSHERHQILLMPEGTDPYRLADNYRKLTSLIIERGFRLGQRLHIEIFGHQPGT